MAITWTLVPEWEFQEVLEWKTDIIQSYGWEQRIALRQRPRRTLRYDFEANNTDYISYANLIGNNPATTFFIGDYAQLDWAMYEEGKWIKNPVRQWTGTKTMVLTNNQGVWDVGEFTATKTGGVIWMLRSEVNSFWATMQPQRVIMAPTVATRLSEPLRITTYDNHRVTFSASFFLFEIPAFWTGTPSYDQLSDGKTLGYVLHHRHYYAGNSSSTWSRNVITLDNEIEPQYISPKTKWKTYKYNFSLRFKVGFELEQFFYFLDAIKGRCKFFYLPVWGAALKPKGGITAGQNSMTVEWFSSVNETLSGKWVAIEYQSRCTTQMLYMKVSGVGPNGINTQISFTQPLTDTVPVERIRSVVFINKVRLDSDTVTITYHADRSATVEMVCVNVNE